MTTKSQVDTAVQEQFANYSNRTPVAVQRGTVSDAPSLCACTMDTFGPKLHPLLDAMFPDHWTPAGRAVAIKRYEASVEHCPHTIHHVKAVDESGRLLGYCRWQFKLPGEEAPTIDDVEGPYWDKDEDRDFANWFHRVYLERRVHAMREKGLNGALFAIDGMSVIPGNQRKGVGRQLVQWGTELADRLGVECTVESAVDAEPFYAKCGFVRQEHAKIEMPPQYKERATQEFIWMTRQSSKASRS